MATQMEALGELICRLNPYTETEDKTTGQTTGEMNLAADMPETATIEELIKKMAVEIESNYSEQWTFKGQPVRVRTAIRIPYQFEVKKKNGKK